MLPQEKLLVEYKQKLLKAIAHLEYSYSKVCLLSTALDQLNEETLETWESFSARFSRVADLFLTKYIRAWVLFDDPGFTGTFRDFINQAEKLNRLDDVDSWMAIRELRNISAHEYTDQDLAQFFHTLRTLAPRLIALKNTL